MIRSILYVLMVWDLVLPYHHVANVYYVLKINRFLCLVML